MLQPIATYITFAEFNGGSPSSPQQFHDELAKYHRDGVISLCSAMNCLLKTWIGGQVDGKIMIFAGGIPLKRDGRVVGAIGVSGGSGDQDHAVAEAGAAAF